jgi:hypothetical protein
MRRKLVIKQASGAVLNEDQKYAHWQIDLTDVPNANATCPLVGVIQTQCNLGCWHDYDTFQLPLWGEA